MPNRTDAVNQFMDKLEHPQKEAVAAVRAAILDSNPDITEHIKWNAPSFCYNGDDRVTLNLHAKDRIQLIFHRGSKPKESKDFAFEDNTGLLEWVAKDRAVVKLHGMEDVNAKKAALTQVVNQWMESTAE